MESALVMSVTLFVLFGLVLMTFWLHDRTAVTADIRWDLERCERVGGSVEPETGKRLLLAKSKIRLEADSKKAECVWSGSGGDVGFGKVLSGSETADKKYSRPGNYLYTNRLLRK